MWAEWWHIFKGKHMSLSIQSHGKVIFVQCSRCRPSAEIWQTQMWYLSHVSDNVCSWPNCRTMHRSFWKSTRSTHLVDPIQIVSMKKLSISNRRSPSFRIWLHSRRLQLVPNTQLQYVQRNLNAWMVSKTVSVTPHIFFSETQLFVTAPYKE